MHVKEQWGVQDDLIVLYLDEVIPRYKHYHSYRIDGIIYKPVPMSHGNGKCIAIRGEGNFVGKEVEFIGEDT